MKIFGFAVCVALVLLGGPAVAGDKGVKPYQCEVNVKPGESTEGCYGCVTEEICEKTNAALKALSEAKEVTLYSLTGRGKSDLPQTNAGPIGGFEVVDFKVFNGELVQDVTSMFRNAIYGENGASACFQPRHALSVKTQDHLYDFILCFECGNMGLYEDEELFFMVGVERDAEALNALMLKAGMALPPYYADKPKQKE